MAEFSLAAFEDAGQQNGFLYWDAHRVMEMLGYQSWQSFQTVITKAMGACTRLNLDPTESFVPETVIEDGKPPRKTYKLSRFACLLVSMTADSKKPDVAKFKAVLAAIADQLIDAQIRTQDLGRLETREDLKLAEKQLGAAAHAAGVEPERFGIFKNAGFLGMYNMSLRELAIRKGIDPSKKTLYDFMGIEELAGNLFRVTQTTARIRNQRVTGLNNVSHTAQQVGHEVRRMMIDNSGQPPEALPLEEDIAAVGKRIRLAKRKMAKLDGPKKAGKRKRPAPAD